MIAEKIEGASYHSRPSPSKTPAGKTAYRGTFAISQHKFLNVPDTLFKDAPQSVKTVFSRVLYYLNSPSKKFGMFHEGKRWFSTVYKDLAIDLAGNYEDDWQFGKGLSPRTVRAAINYLEKLGVIISMRAAHSKKHYTIDVIKIRELYPNISWPQLDSYEKLLAENVRLTGRKCQNNKEDNNTLQKEGIYVNPPGKEEKDGASQEGVSPTPIPLKETPTPLEVARRMLEIWNEKVQTQRLTGYTKALAPREDRLEALLQALKDYFKDDIEEWRHYCRLVGSSENCLGKNKNSWVATLAWCLKEGTIEGIYNGEYGVKDIPKLTVVSDNTLLLPHENLHPLEKVYREALIKHYGESTYRSWFMPTKFTMEENNLYIIAPSRFMRDRIKLDYGDTLEVYGRQILSVEHFHYQVS